MHDSDEIHIRVDGQHVVIALGEEERYLDIPQVENLELLLSLCKEVVEENSLVIH